MILVLFQNHQQKKREEAFKAKKALINISCKEVTKESNRPMFMKNGYYYKYNDLYLTGSAKNVSGKRLRGVVLRSYISDAKDSAEGELLINVGDMEPGEVYEINKFVKEVSEKIELRRTKNCSIEDVEVVDPK